MLIIIREGGSFLEDLGLQASVRFLCPMLWIRAPVPDSRSLVEMFGVKKGKERLDEGENPGESTSVFSWWRCVCMDPWMGFLQPSASPPSPLFPLVGLGGTRYRLTHTGALRCIDSNL